jgi:hypothetical protein
MKAGITKSDVIVFYLFFVMTIVFSICFLVCYQPLHAIKKTMILKHKKRDSAESFYPPVNATVAGVLSVHHH